MIFLVHSTQIENVVSKSDLLKIRFFMRNGSSRLISDQNKQKLKLRIEMNTEASSIQFI